MLDQFIHYQAERSHLKVYPIMEDIDGLETSVLGLHFTIKSRHFRKGDVKLKCTATLAALYWQSNEASAEPDRPVHHQRSSTSGVYMDHNGASTALASAALSTVHHFIGNRFVFIHSSSQLISDHRFDILIGWWWHLAIANPYGRTSKAFLQLDSIDSNRKRIFYLGPLHRSALSVCFVVALVAYMIGTISWRWLTSSLNLFVQHWAKRKDKQKWCKQ